MSIAAAPVAPVDAAASFNWEVEIAGLLADLSSAQEELLDVLVEKRALLARGDVPGLTAIQEREETLIRRLEGCQQQRAALLASAKESDRPSASIATLADSLTGLPREKLGRQVKDSKQRMRLLQNETLTNWVLAQRLLLHVSQMLEIIATGGRLQPTYSEGDTSIHARGALVNDEA